jgi:hypothetical protein
MGRLSRDIDNKFPRLTATTVILSQLPRSSGMPSAPLLNAGETFRSVLISAALQMT